MAHWRRFGEIYAMSQSGTLMNASPSVGEGFVIAHDLEQVENRFRYAGEEDSLLLGSRDWEEIRNFDETEGAELPERRVHDLDAFRRDRDDVVEEMSRRHEALLADVAAAAGGVLPDEEVEVVVDDLERIAMNVALLDHPLLVNSLMLKCYRLGGYPCGWQGDFPDGTMVALAFPRGTE